MQLVSDANLKHIWQKQIGYSAWPKEATYSLGGVEKGKIYYNIEETLAALLGYQSKAKGAKEMSDEVKKKFINADGLNHIWSTQIGYKPNDRIPTIDIGKIKIGDTSLSTIESVLNALVFPEYDVEIADGQFEGTQKYDRLTPTIEYGGTVTWDYIGGSSPIQTIILSDGETEITCNIDQEKLADEINYTHKEYPVTIANNKITWEVKHIYNEEYSILDNIEETKTYTLTITDNRGEANQQTTSTDVPYIFKYIDLKVDMTSKISLSNEYFYNNNFNGQTTITLTINDDYQEGTMKDLGWVITNVDKKNWEFNPAKYPITIKYQGKGREDITIQPIVVFKKNDQTIKTVVTDSYTLKYQPPQSSIDYSSPFYSFNEPITLTRSWSSGSYNLPNSDTYTQEYSMTNDDTKHSMFTIATEKQTVKDEQGHTTDYASKEYKVYKQITGGWGIFTDDLSFNQHIEVKMNYQSMKNKSYKFTHNKDKGYLCLTLDDFPSGLKYSLKSTGLSGQLETVYNQFQDRKDENYLLSKSQYIPSNQVEHEITLIWEEDKN